MLPSPLLQRADDLNRRLSDRLSDPLCSRALTPLVNLITKRTYEPGDEIKAGEILDGLEALDTDLSKLLLDHGLLADCPADDADRSAA